MKTYSLLFVLFLLGSDSYAQNKPDSLHKEVNGRFPAITPQLKILPNPVQHRAEFEVRYFDAGEASVQIFNTEGNSVYHARRLIAGADDRIVLLLQLPTGIYFCTVQQKQKKAKGRMVVE
jgi:hypothetical protein